MREIKFRAWDKEESRWVPQEEFGLTSTGYLLSRMASNRYSCDEIPVVISQFTGLKDKNGKDIYEGDVLRRPGFDSEWIVVFKNDRFLKRNSNAGHSNIDCGEEVIGNIYENPELIEAGA